MSETKPAHLEADWNRLSDAEANKLLESTASRQRRPVDEVIDRLHQPDGADWFAAALRRHPDAWATITVETTTLDDLRCLKELAKASFQHAGSRTEHLEATLVYVLALGLALAEHSTLITSQPRDEVEAMVADLVAVAPRPWSLRLERAFDGD